MKVINDSPVLRVCAERQVLLYPTDWEDNSPETMEDIKISIVNERATGSKRERDEITPVTPCSKRSHHAVFSCSTPSSASVILWETQNSDFPAWHSLEQNHDQNEWDDSLLEPSDNEDDSPLCLTKDEIETLLDEDDDDSCYAAEPLTKYELTTCVVTFTSSENKATDGGASPCKTLDISDSLNKEPDFEGDVCNYAAMPPSPCQLTLEPAMATEANQTSVCNAESPPSKTKINGDEPVPLSDMKNVIANSCSIKLLLHPSLSLSGIDAAVDWTEDPDLAFDCDIDNLLAISPGVTFSSEDDNVAEMAATTDNSPVISDSTVQARDLKSDQVLTAQAACPSTLGAPQNFSPLLSLNTPILSKVHHPHHSADPESLKEPLSSTTCFIVPNEPKQSTESPGTEQNAVFQKTLEAEERERIQSKESTSSPPNSSLSATPEASDNQSKIVASLFNNASSSSGQEKEKQKIAVAAVPRRSFREFLSEFEMETNKDIYCDKVLMHIDGQGDGNLEDPHYELASLLNHISRENQNWQHPSDYTKRNHPRVGKKPTKRCSLGQWVTKNGGPNERFKNVPATFQRSPVPNVLPFGSS